MECHNKVITVPMIDNESILQIHVSLNSVNNAIEVDSWEQGNIVSNRFVHNDNVDATPDEVTEAIAGHFDITISDNDFPFLFLTSPQYDNVKSELMKRSTP